MFLSKRLFNKKFKDIRLSYVILEIILIFIGVTFANIAYEKSLQKKENKFVLENLKLFKNELTTSIKFNERSLKMHEGLQKDYENFYSLFKDSNVSEEEIIENQNKSIEIIMGYFKLGEQIGLNNILNGDLDLIKNFEFTTKLLHFSRVIEHMNNSIDYYNDEIYKMHELMIEDISIDFSLNKMTGFKNIEGLRENTHFRNQLDLVVYSRKHYLSDIRILNNYYKEMIENIDEYIDNYH